MKVAIVGCGVMGSALARHLSTRNTIIICNRTRKKAQSLAKEIQAEVCLNMNNAMQKADILILALKPKDFLKFTKDIESSLSKGKIIISILSGVSTHLLKHYFPLAHCVRAMPNLALICSEAVIGLSEDKELPMYVRNKVTLLLNGLGLVMWISEEKMEALASLNSSGLGFIFLFVEAMIEGGIFMGFEPHRAKELVLKAMEGSIALLRESKKHPAELKWQVCSPAGTTIAGGKTMEEKGVRSGIIDGILVTYQRGLELSKEIR